MRLAASHTAIGSPFPRGTGKRRVLAGTKDCGQAPKPLSKRTSWIVGTVQKKALPWFLILGQLKKSLLFAGVSVIVVRCDACRTQHTCSFNPQLKRELTRKVQLTWRQQIALLRMEPHPTRGGHARGPSCRQGKFDCLDAKIGAVAKLRTARWRVGKLGAARR